MISFINTRPALLIGSYQVIDYDTSWLDDALRRASSELELLQCFLRRHVLGQEEGTARYRAYVAESPAMIGASIMDAAVEYDGREMEGFIG